MLRLVPWLLIRGAGRKVMIRVIIDVVGGDEQPLRSEHELTMRTCSRSAADQRFYALASGHCEWQACMRSGG
jgi:hypothetical protein